MRAPSSAAAWRCAAPAPYISTARRSRSCVSRLGSGGKRSHHHRGHRRDAAAAKQCSRPGSSWRCRNAAIASRGRSCRPRRCWRRTRSRAMPTSTLRWRETSAAAAPIPRIREAIKRRARRRSVKQREWLPNRNDRRSADGAAVDPTSGRRLLLPRFLQARLAASAGPAARLPTCLRRTARAERSEPPLRPTPSFASEATAKSPSPCPTSRWARAPTPPYRC